MASGQPSIPTHMKAQLLEAYNTPYALKEIPVPALTSPNDLLIRLDAAGYCHTDAVIAEGEWANVPRQFPHISGHEIAGTIVRKASPSSTAADELPIGTRVASPGRGYNPCGECFECRDPGNDYEGYSFFCPRSVSNGSSKHGGFAEYVVVDARQVVPLPDGLSAVDAAPLMCAGVTIYSALKRCNLSPGQRVGIIGCGGGLGHLGLQFAEAMGLRVTGVDAAPGALELAKSLGTKAHIVDARATPAEDLVRHIGKEDGKTDRADFGLDAVLILPDTQKSFDYGTTLLRNHGLCIVVSFLERGFQVSASDLVFRDLTIRGTMLGTHETLRETVEFAAKHNIKSVKQTFALNKLGDLVDRYRAGGGGKLVLDMSL